jgi:hypothetical protein
MYVVAGLMLERVSGARWDDFVRTRNPAAAGDEMGRDLAGGDDRTLSGLGDRARVHQREQRRLPVRLIKARSAGGICGSIADMAAYLRFHLDPIAARDGLRLSPAVATELDDAANPCGPFGICRDRPGALRLRVLCLALSRGPQCHGGGPWSGYNCDLCLLPEHGGGVMVLTNGHDPGARR